MPESEGSGSPEEVTLSNREKISTGIAIDRNNLTAQHIATAIEVSPERKIPYSKFMQISLYGQDGYYSKGKAEIDNVDDFGTEATSSELFGATIGKAAKKVWEALDKPNAFTFVEMGAGNGIMAKDILTWARENEPQFYEALQYTIVEYGELIEKQKKSILDPSSFDRTYADSYPDEAIGQRDLQKVRWIKASAIALPLSEVEGIFVSNELPDAFPVEVVKIINGQVRQKYVALENDIWVERWDEPAETVISHITEFGINLEEDKEQAININAVNWQKRVNQVLKRGAQITIDYPSNGKYLV